MIYRRGWVLRWDDLFITFPFGIKGRFPILFIRFDNSSSIPNMNLLFESGSSPLWKRFNFVNGCFVVFAWQVPFPVLSAVYWLSDLFTLTLKILLSTYASYLHLVSGVLEESRLSLSQWSSCLSWSSSSCLPFRFLVDFSARENVRLHKLAWIGIRTSVAWGNDGVDKI